MPSSHQRRQFLKALGCGATALPFFRLLESSAVQAQGVARPLRLLALCTGFGGHWGYLRPPGVAAGTTDLALTPELLTYENSVLEPLKGFASQMLVLEGIARTTGLMPYAAKGTGRTFYSGHDGYAPTAFTGSAVSEQPGANVPTGPSIDFVLGQQLGAGTAVRSLQIGVGSVRGIPDQVNLSYNMSGAAQPAIEDPAAFYRQMFGNAGAPSSGTPMVDDSAKIRQAQDLSIVGALSSSAKRLQGRLGATEKAKLDDHLAALADIENRLKGASSPNDPIKYPPVVCDSPAVPAKGTTGTLQEATELHFDVLTQAFACDRTRFVVADWGIDRGTVEMLPDVKDLHGEVAHQLEEGGGDPANNIPPTTKAMTDLAKLNMAKLQRWYAQQLANLMTRMSQTPDGDGSLLDNTLIIWSSDFGENVHGGLNVPHILLGGAQKKFRMGRYLNFAPTSGHPAYNNDIPVYQPHNRLLVSVLQAFGLDVNQFGSDEYTGSLPNLT